ncbi:hypothetical protein PFLmoz3_04171 [Pseudomonas fluorescens]|uniref:Uncharacterized protein n=1 Tax=Pseudomonas fluorescens TaxID=294 RepID=A0A125QI10_PSEFL|nr:hypothetical protein PFLmoz3_04171 [Pseudomonas fluorescens]
MSHHSHRQRSGEIGNQVDLRPALHTRQQVCGHCGDRRFERHQRLAAKRRGEQCSVLGVFAAVHGHNGVPQQRPNLPGVVAIACPWVGQRGFDIHMPTDQPNIGGLVVRDRQCGA